MSGEEARERQEAVERFLARAEMTMVGVLSLEELRPTTSQVAQTLRIRLADAWGKARDRRRRSDGEDLRAAATLTSFLRQRHTRSSSHASAPDDNEAADLMLFLATSPSPARPSRRPPDLNNKGRILFPSSDDASSDPRHPQQDPDFNFNDFINASPSPSAHPHRRNVSLRADVGRRLFEEEQSRHLSNK